MFLLMAILQTWNKEQKSLLENNETFLIVSYTDQWSLYDNALSSSDINMI